MGRKFSAFLRGYAGISTIISYILIVGKSIADWKGTQANWVIGFFDVTAPILAMLGYFAFWGVTAVIYDKITMFNNPKLLKKYRIPTYEAIMHQISKEGMGDARSIKE